MGLRRYEPSISTVGEGEDLKSLLLMCCVHPRICVSVAIYSYAVQNIKRQNLTMNYWTTEQYQCSLPVKSENRSVPQVSFLYSTLQHHIKYFIDLLPTLLAERAELEPN